MNGHHLHYPNQFVKFLYFPIRPGTSSYTNSSDEYCCFNLVLFAIWYKSRSLLVLPLQQFRLAGVAHLEAICYNIIQIPYVFSFSKVIATKGYASLWLCISIV